MISISSPDTITHGIPTTITGTDLQLVSLVSLKQGFTDLLQSPDSLGGSTIDFTPYIGEASGYGPLGAEDFIPYTTLNLSIGTTPYQAYLEIDDLTETATNNVDNIPPSGLQVFQGMSSLINTTKGEGFGSSNIIEVEDNMQLTLPEQVDGVSIVVNPDTWEYAIDKLELPEGNSIAFDASYYSPSTMKESKVLFTIVAPSSSQDSESKSPTSIVTTYTTIISSTFTSTIG